MHTTRLQALSLANIDGRAIVRYQSLQTSAKQSESLVSVERAPLAMREIVQRLHLLLRSRDACWGIRRFPIRGCEANRSFAARGFFKARSWRKSPLDLQ